MSRSSTDMYKYYVANLRELELAISHTARMARSEIASKDPQRSLRSLLRLYSFLIGAWAETRLKKLLYEQSGFNESERNIVLSESSQLEQWKKTIELAFRKHHKITKATLDKYSLGITEGAKFDALNDVLSNELKIIIEIRNKLAHGQWVYPLNNNETAVESDKYRLINQENFQSLQFKYSLIKHLVNVVHDLVVSETTFKRDFDSHFRKLLQVRTNLKTKSYEKYKESLILSREKARTLRKNR